MTLRSASPLLVILAASCAPPDAAAPGGDSRGPELRSQPGEVVYGRDDRLDYYAHPDPALRDLTRQSIVALMDGSSLESNGDGTFTPVGGTLGRSQGLCRDERFYDQITAASCSGTLIDDDLVLTAGHCADSSTACSRAVWIFNYYLESETALATIEVADVYECAQILVTEQPSRSSSLDYAIVKLDRPATPRHQPAEVVGRRQILDQGQPVTIIGFGSGLPAKIDNGGSVLDPDPSGGEYFRASTDSFGGNSGSGVFDEARRVVGILVNGDQDYTFSGGCVRVNDVPESGGSMGGEGVIYAFNAVQDLCSTGYQSERLCGTAAVCGDAFCGDGETEASCPDDCASTCGNNQCDARDAEACPDECGDAPPPAWTCPDANWAGGDGCDCACGAFDPDCEEPAADVYNCRPGEVCDADGLCAAPGADTGVDAGGDTTADAGPDATADTSPDSGPTPDAGGDADTGNDTGGIDDTSAIGDGTPGFGPPREASSRSIGTEGCSAAPAAGVASLWPALLGLLTLRRRRRHR
jgi:hypothetical protein